MRGVLSNTTGSRVTVSYKAMYSRIPVVRQKLLLLRRYIMENREKIVFERISVDEYLTGIDKDLSAIERVEAILEQKIHIRQNADMYVLPYL